MVSRTNGTVTGVPSEPRHTSGVTTKLILQYVRARGGVPAVQAVVERAGVADRAAALSDERCWSSYGTKIALFEAAAAVLDDEDVARAVGESVIGAQVAGPVKAVVTALGSPQQVLRHVAKANVKFSTSATMRSIEARAGRAIVAYRLHDGLPPSRHDCRYNVGLLAQATVVFGLPPAEVRHPACQVEGAEECVYDIRWRLRDSARRRLHPVGRATPEVIALRGQLEGLQRTAAELVHYTALDDLLQKIIERTGSAVPAQRHLLAVRLAGEQEPRIHGDGFGRSAARRAGAALLAGAAEPGDERAVADIASGGRRYGRLAAYLPPGTGFLESEQSLLESYAALAAAALDNAAAHETARRRGMRAQALLELARTLVLARGEDAVTAAVADAVLPVLGADTAVVFLWEPAEQALVPRAFAGFPGPSADDIRAYRIPLGSTPQLDAMLSHPAPMLFDRDDADLFVRDSVRRFGSAQVGVAPIVVHDAFVGTVHAGWAGRCTSFDADLVGALASLADHTGLALGNVRMLADARHQATHDALTGLPNRVLLTDRLAGAVARWRRTGEEAAVCFLDLDGFKGVNDTLGHAAGDEVLVVVTERIRAVVREADVVARLAGDEFAILLERPGTSEELAEVAARLIAAIVEPYEVAAGVARVGVSIGIAVVPRHGATPEALLRRADAAMYEAKAQGCAHRLSPAPT